MDKVTIFYILILTVIFFLMAGLCIFKKHTSWEKYNVRTSAKWNVLLLIFSIFVSLIVLVTKDIEFVTSYTILTLFTVLLLLGISSLAVFKYKEDKE